MVDRLARADDGRVLRTNEGDSLDHPGGGCRVGTDPSASVVDSHGRSHDHDNPWVLRSPTLPTVGCTNGILIFVAVTLRSAEKLAGLLASPPPPSADAASGAARH